MGTNNSSLTPLNCMLKNWDRFDPQSLKKTHLVFLCDNEWSQYPLEDSERWSVGGSLKYNTVLQLDRFCRKQGDWAEAAYVLPFFSLRNMPDFCPKAIDLVVKLSVPSCPPTLPPYLGLPTEQTERQSNASPPPRRVALVSVETQAEIQTAQVEVQTTRSKTTLVSIETQIIEVRDEMEDRRQRDKEKQVSPIYT